MLYYLHTRFPSDLILEPSSTQSDFPPESIFIQNKYWRSNDVARSNFSFGFQRFLFRIDSFSSESCRYRECFKDLDIYGSNKNQNLEQICSFRGSYDIFYQKISNIQCKSDKFYDKITLISPSINSNNENKFTFYSFEIFGDLYDINASRIICSQKNCIYTYDFDILIYFCIVNPK